MKVKQLIEELKKMPQNLEAEVAMHDNDKYETAGSVCMVNHFIKDDFSDARMCNDSRMVFNDMPDECVILHC